MGQKRDKKPLCPNCKSCEIIPLLGVLAGYTAYDSTSPTLLPAAQCQATDEAVDPDWRCKDCGYEWATAGNEEANE